METVRSALKRGLALVGLAPIRQVRALAGEVDRAQARAAADREEARRWKREAEQTAKAGATAEREARQWRTRAEESKTKVEEWKARADEWQGRAEQYLVQLRDVKAKLTRTEHATRLAHEHLMATEVKLDLVEAAIRALDARTRAVTPDGPPADTPTSGRPSASSVDPEGA